MKQPPRIGSIGEQRFVVEGRHLISFADDQMPAVLATPWLVAQLEYTARDLVAPLLEPDERTVGVEVAINHHAPVPPGFTVTCRARVIGVDETLLTFQVEAHDGVEKVASGLHRRRVIRVDRFRRRVERKQRDGKGSAAAGSGSVSEG